MMKLLLVAIMVFLALGQSLRKDEPTVKSISEDPLLEQVVEDDLNSLRSDDDGDEDGTLSAIVEEEEISLNSVADKNDKDDKTSKTEKSSKKGKGLDKKIKWANFRRSIVNEAVKKTIAIIKARSRGIVQNATKPLQDQIKKLEEWRNSGAGATKKELLDDISTNGLKFNNWALREEGGYFVIRDTRNKNGDYRYSFAPTRFVDV